MFNLTNLLNKWREMKVKKLRNKRGLHYCINLNSRVTTNNIHHESCLSVESIVNKEWITEETAKKLISDEHLNVVIPNYDITGKTFKACPRCMRNFKS
jgi:hypothetical protein